MPSIYSDNLIKYKSCGWEVEMGGGEGGGGRLPDLDQKLIHAGEKHTPATLVQV